ncbi:hypothetical protein Hesp01_75590 [Herbidospora sp. NBRC 101105]|nr:hypothetical protein Hesp01_75590 [Herbidospora sp. NBRC 101105]
MPGPREPLFLLAELEAWRGEWEATRERPAPAAITIPGDPNARRTHSHTDQPSDGPNEAAHEDHGARRHYRVGDIIDILNTRKGAGVARDSECDRRRNRLR